MRRAVNMKPLMILSALAVTVAVQAQVDPDRVVVTVNGTEIKGREYYSRMEIQPGLGAAANTGKFIQVYPGYLTLRLLIEEHLIIQLAQSQKVAPTTQQFDTEYKERLETNPEQFKSWLAMGFTEADMKHEVLVDMCQFLILTKGITITDFEAEKYYKEHMDKFTLPKRYQTRMIRVSDEEGKKAVDAALLGGAKFADVASSHSVDISKLNGGSMGLIADGEVTPTVRTALSATKKGQTTTWVTQGKEFAKFLVEDVKGIEVLQLDAKLKRGIRETLMRERGQAKNSVPMMMLDFRKKAVIEFGNYPFSADLKRFFEIGG